MAFCEISNITNPTSSSSFEEGASFTLTWSFAGVCSDWFINQVKLQSNYSSSWSDIATLFSGTDGVTSGSLGLTLPSSVTNPGDYYRLKVTYTQAQGEG